jgi:hypothetical protein
MGKSVSFSTVTVYEFGVALGGSAVPRLGGPSVGLARTASSVWSAPLDAVENVAATGDARSAKRAVQPKARRRVRWLKPLERVAMLEKAGYSERRILRMLLESSRIAQSRRLCLRV